MKRDMELVRKILLQIEASDKISLRVADLGEASSSHIVLYHLQLLDEAGLIQAKPLEVDAGVVDYLIYRLTWAGHEFLDAARNEGVWSRAKEIIAEKAQTVPFQLMLAIMLQVLKAKFGIK